MAIAHPQLTGGDSCPDRGSGKVYVQKEPKALVRIVGQAPLAATIYELQRLRCNACGQVFTAQEPEGVGPEKYDETAADRLGRESVLHSFSGYPHDGNDPRASLILDNIGSLYGTTFEGGSDGVGGTVFKVDSRGHETVLYNFQGVKKGRLPYADLIRDAQGNLYGTTAQGGPCPFTPQGCGTLFKLDQRGNLTVLYGFARSGDGFVPRSALIRDAQGNFYGTAFAGGDLNCDQGGGCGTVFKFKP